MDRSAKPTPLAVRIAAAATAGFIIVAALVVWLERGPAILLDLSHLTVAFICP